MTPRAHAAAAQPSPEHGSRRQHLANFEQNLNKTRQAAIDSACTAMASMLLPTMHSDAWFAAMRRSVGGQQVDLADDEDATLLRAERRFAQKVVESRGLFCF